MDRKSWRAILLETASLKAQLEFVDLFTSSSEVASQKGKIRLQMENSCRSWRQCNNSLAASAPSDQRREEEPRRECGTQLHDS